MDSEREPQSEIELNKVPEHLRDMIPMAEKWGIGDDVLRVDAEGGATDKEKAEFVGALRGRTDEITAWLDSFDAGLEGNNPMSEEAGYFMNMLQALDESGLWPD